VGRMLNAAIHGQGAPRPEWHLPLAAAMSRLTAGVRGLYSLGNSALDLPAPAESLCPLPSPHARSTCSDDRVFSRAAIRSRRP
jgi:hypothetical protein